MVLNLLVLTYPQIRIVPLCVPPNQNCIPFAYPQIINPTQNKHVVQCVFLFGGARRGCKSDLGIRRGVQFWCGGTWVVSTKRLRTTALYHKKVFCKVFLTHTHLRPHPPPTIAVYPNCKPLLYLTLSTDLNLFVSFDKMFEIKFSFRIPILFWPNISLGKPTLRCSESTKHFPQLKQTRRNLIYGKNGKIVKW